MHDLPLLAPETTAALNHLQCLDDAIAYRSARLAAPCPACAAGGRCPDHAGDERLIGDYRHRQARALRAFLARFDSADVTAVMTGSAGTPAAVLATAVAMAARLRELAAAGPFITTLGDDSVVVRLDAGRLIEYPLAPPRRDPRTGT